MEFRKMLMTILYARQQKRHRCIEQFLDSVGESKGGKINKDRAGDLKVYISNKILPVGPLPRQLVHSFNTFCNYSIHKRLKTELLVLMSLFSP